MSPLRPTPAVLLALLAGCEQPEPAIADPWFPERPECELIELASPQLGELDPSDEYRIACGEHDEIWSPSIGLVGDSTWVLADGSRKYSSSWRLYRVTDGQLDALPWARDPDNAVLLVDDQSQPWLFDQSSGALMFARPDPSAMQVEWTATGSSGFVRRAELVGSTPQVFLSAGVNGLMRASINAAGEWYATAALAIEGDFYPPSIGLDGLGTQMVYATRRADDHVSLEVWVYDGHTTKLLDSFADLYGWIQPIPTAHPNDVAHQHAAYVERESGVTVLWPDSGDSVTVPRSPSFADLDECMLFGRTTVATRTADGRIWLAWVVHALPSCGLPAIEAPTLRLVEVDPEQRSAREVMRLQLDATHFRLSDGFLPPNLELGVAMTSYADQLALVIPDGPEHQPLHVIRVDVGSI